MTLLGNLGHGALTGTYEEVSCSQWSGSDGSELWNGACISGESAALWPSTACGNQGQFECNVPSSKYTNSNSNFNLGLITVILQRHGSIMKRAVDKPYS